MGACIYIEVLVVLRYDVVIMRPTPCLHRLISEASIIVIASFYCAALIWYA